MTAFTQLMPTVMPASINTSDRYTAIPNELKLLRQWVCWRYELRINDRGEDVKTKVPYNFVTGTKASVSNSGTWNCFEDACAASDYDGVGFVFTRHDDFVFIDLDNKQNDPTIEAAHKKAIEHFDSYTERSPSGTGYHIICKGVTARDGIRSGSYEVYADKRYATFTGDCVRKAGVIKERQEQIDQLWGYIAKLQGAAGASPAGLRLDAATLAYIAERSREPATESDEAVIERAKKAGNGAKFEALWNGAWQGAYKSQSEADMALANILQFYAPNAEQFLRLFHASGLGQRDKAYRSDYVQRTLLKAFDRTLPPIRIEGEAEGLAILAEKVRARDAAAAGQGAATRLETPISRGEAFPSPVSTVPVSFPTIDAADFAGRRVPSRQWFIFELIPARAVTMLAGDGGVGKSLLALQLAVASVTGAQWLGMNAQRGPILYLSAEDEEDEIHRRLDRIITAQGCPYCDLKGLTFATLAGKDAILAAPNAKGVFEPTALFAKVRAQLAEVRPCLLVIDNLADVFGGDEIKKVQVRQFINMLSGLAIEFNMTVLLLSHPSQSGITSGSGTSGNVAWNNSVRSRLYLTASDNKENKDIVDIRELTVMKANYAAKGGKLMLRYQDGVFNLVANNSKVNKASDDEADAAFLQLLGQFTNTNREVSIAKTSPNYAPKAFTNQLGSNGITVAQFERAMERLIDNGKVKNESYGSASKGKKKLVITPAELFSEAPT